MSDINPDNVSYQPDLDRLSPTLSAGSDSDDESSVGPHQPAPVAGGAGPSSPAPGPRGPPPRDVAPGETGAPAGSTGPTCRNWIVTTFASLHFPGGFTESAIYPAIGRGIIGPRVSFFAGQEEICPDTRTRHGHFVVCLNRPCKRGLIAKLFHDAYRGTDSVGARVLADWSNWLRRSHFEPVRDLQAAIDYVTKEDSRSAGPYVFGVRPRGGQVRATVKLSSTDIYYVTPGHARTPIDDAAIYLLRLGAGGVLSPLLWKAEDPVPEDEHE